MSGPFGTVQVELDRLRRESAQRAAAAVQYQRAAAAVSAAQHSSHQEFAQQGVGQQGSGLAGDAGAAEDRRGCAAPPAVSEQLLRSLKVSWYLKVGFIKTWMSALKPNLLSRCPRV